MYGGHQMDNSTTAELRWKDNDMVSYVEEILGGYQKMIDENGQEVRVRPPYFVPKVNDDGLSGIVMFLRVHITPSIVLSNFDEVKANSLIRIQLTEFAKWLCINQERFSIKTGDLSLIQSIIRPLVFSQIYRSVNGHEAKNFHMQSFEQNVSQHSTLQNPQQSWWSFGKKGR
jgi:hypothetical protein